jgi:hypothetical protein
MLPGMLAQKYMDRSGINCIKTIYMKEVQNPQKTTSHSKSKTVFGGFLQELGVLGHTQG